MPRKQIYFGFQYINESSVKFVQNISTLISKNFNYIPYFNKGRNLLLYFSSKFKEFDKDTSVGVYNIEFLVTTVLNATLEKQALTLRIKEHQANCRNQNQHSAVG